MATRPPVPPPSNLGEMTPEQIRQQSEGTAPPQPQAPPQQPTPGPAPAPMPPQPPAPPPPQPSQPPSTMPATGAPLAVQQPDGTFAVQLRTGQRYVGRTPDEAYGQLAEGQANASEEIRRIRAEQDRLQQGLRIIAGGEQDPNAPVRFDPNVLQQLQQQDPQLAFLYQMQHALGFNSIDEVIPALQETRTYAMEYKNNYEINRFRALAPDFPGSPEAVNRLMDTMRDSKIPFSAENMNLVHRYMVAQHAANPQLGYAPAQVQPPQQPGYAVQPAVPPPQPQQPVYNPAPMAGYGFNPAGGFVQAPVAPAQFPTMPVAQPQYQPQPQNPYAGYPAAPVAPLPTLSAQPPAPTGPAQLTEQAMAEMTPEQLRQAFETQFQR